jgi:hypothetical protein
VAWRATGSQTQGVHSGTTAYSITVIDEPLRETEPSVLPAQRGTIGPATEIVDAGHGEVRFQGAETTSEAISSLAGTFVPQIMFRAR